MVATATIEQLYCLTRNVRAEMRIPHRHLNRGVSHQFLNHLQRYAAHGQMARERVGGPDLTNELIRLHDERYSALLAAGAATAATLPRWAQECSAQLATAASKNPAFEKGKLVEHYGTLVELRVEFSGERVLAAMLTVKRPGPPPKVIAEWFSPPRSDEPGFMLVKGVDGREVTLAGSDAHDPLREDFEKTFKPILENCLQN